MMTNNPFFDDMAKLATSAGSTMLEWRKHVEQMVQDQMQSVASKMDMVSREEFEVVRELAQTAMAENAKLKERLDVMESTATKKPSAKTGATAKKPAKK